MKKCKETEHKYEQALGCHKESTESGRREILTQYRDKIFCVNCGHTKKV